MLRKLSLFFALGIFLIPTGVLAANVAPEFNPICWKEEECLKQRKEYLRQFGDNLTPEERESLNEGFLLGESPCPAPWGKCLPATIARTQIRFGGENRFADIGQFLFKNYNLAISLAGIVASIVVVIAGFQWAMSGGNADTIGKAKKRIGGAIVGLLIAYTSYVILHTINPDLVNLRLPQAYMIKPQNVMPKMCSAAPRSSMFHKAAEANDQQSNIDTSQSFSEYELKYEQVSDLNFMEGPNCGARYVMKDGGALTCYGDVCAPGTTCSNINMDDPSDTQYKCRQGSISGEIVANYFVQPSCLSNTVTRDSTGYEYPWIDTDTGMNSIARVCDDNGTIRLEFPDSRPQAVVKENGIDKPVLFRLGYASAASLDKKCQTGNYLGYGLTLELDAACVSSDIEHLIDKNGSDLGILDSGEGEWELVQKVSSVTSENLFTPEEIEKGSRLFIDVGSYLQEKK